MPRRVLYEHRPCDFRMDRFASALPRTRWMYQAAAFEFVPSGLDRLDPHPQAVRDHGPLASSHIPWPGLQPWGSLVIGQLSEARGGALSRRRPESQPAIDLVLWCGERRVPAFMFRIPPAADSLRFLFVTVRYSQPDSMLRCLWRAQRNLGVILPSSLRMKPPLPVSLPIDFGHYGPP